MGDKDRDEPDLLLWALSTLNKPGEGISAIDSGISKELNSGSGEVE